MNTILLFNRCCGKGFSSAKKLHVYLKEKGIETTIKASRSVELRREYNLTRAEIKADPRIIYNGEVYKASEIQEKINNNSIKLQESIQNNTLPFTFKIEKKGD